MLKKIGLILLIILYIGAGVNHFIHPEPYYSIIPPYIPYPYAINIIAGLLEIIFGFFLISASIRKFAVYGIILMLIAFLPAHIFMIQRGGCMGPKPALCTTLFIAWLRLPLQGVLIWWAWVYRPRTKSQESRLLKTWQYYKLRHL